MCSFHGKLLRPTAGTAGDLECHTRTNHHPPVIASQAALAQRGRLPTLCASAGGCYPSLPSPLPSAQLSCSDGLPTRTVGPLDPNAVSDSTA
jgi:hypothetical protein